MNRLFTSTKYTGYYYGECLSSNFKMQRTTTTRPPTSPKKRVDFMVKMFEFCSIKKVRILMLQTDGMNTWLIQSKGVSKFCLKNPALKKYFKTFCKFQGPNYKYFD